MLQPGIHSFKLARSGNFSKGCSRHSRSIAAVVAYKDLLAGRRTNTSLNSWMMSVRIDCVHVYRCVHMIRIRFPHFTARTNFENAFLARLTRRQSLYAHADNSKHEDDYDDREKNPSHVVCNCWIDIYSV